MTKIQLDEAIEAFGAKSGGAASSNRVQVRLTCISEMRGTYPDIGLPEDIDRTALGEAAFFVTLPIGQAGARSRNQRTYSRAAVEQMVAQINQQRPEGMWGHLAAEEAQTRYDPPAIRWLAAQMDAEGIAWGKGLPLTEQAREYYRLAKATNARVGTSLVAWAQMDGDEVKALELVTVDLADPARVGVPITAAKPGISREMSTTENTEDTEKVEKRQVEPPRRQDRQETSPKDTEAQRAKMAALVEMLGEGDVVARVRALLDEKSGWIAEREALREEAALLQDAAITAAVERVVVPARRGFAAAAALVEELVRSRQPQTQGEITAAVAAVVESDSVRSLLRAELQQAMGPSQRRPVRREGKASGYFEFGE